MNIYMFAEHDDIDEIRPSMVKDLSVWAEPKTTVFIANRDREGSNEPKTHRFVEIGVEIAVGKVQKLKEPLNTLYKLSKKYQCDFVVGVIEDGVYQDVCYFGHEEGRPDMFEIANYLGFDD